MKISLIIIAAGAFLAFCASTFALAKERTAVSSLQLIGSAFLAVMVCTHFAEMFHLFPRMGWGLPHSPGHYIDLLSAWGGAALFALGYFLRKHTRRRP